MSTVCDKFSGDWWFCRPSVFCYTPVDPQDVYDTSTACDAVLKHHEPAERQKWRTASTPPTWMCSNQGFPGEWGEKWNRQQSSFVKLTSTRKTTNTPLPHTNHILPAPVPWKLLFPMRIKEKNPQSPHTSLFSVLWLTELLVVFRERNLICI